MEVGLLKEVQDKLVTEITDLQNHFSGLENGQKNLNIETLPEDTVGYFQKQSLIKDHATDQLHMMHHKTFICPHLDKKHYAKNMCHACYHSKGKSKMAYACGHTHKPHYSKGLC